MENLGTQGSDFDVYIIETKVCRNHWGVIISLRKNISEIDYNIPSFILEYNYKLSQLGRHLYTKRAVELWKTRNEYAHKFYEGLLVEIKNILWYKDVYEGNLQKNKKNKPVTNIERVITLSIILYL